MLLFYHLITISAANGRKIVEIQNIKFSGKRKIDWEGVEAYLKKYVGKSYMLDETDEMIYIGTDFPDEYSQSRDSKKALGAIGKAKAEKITCMTL